jgi:serine/threonine protein kinase
MVMEYLDGETLDEVLQRRKKLPANEAVRVVHQVLQGLQHIHDKGMIHRDLKPANLMLVPARAANEPDTTLNATLKILDIGLGRELFEESAQTAAQNLQLTGEGVLLGTPDYLAPEQARDPRTIDIRADIYSLGCVLYHLLTGQPPFPDTNVLNQMVRHATEAPRPLAEVTPGVPDGLQQVLNWMMAKEPAQRYATPERAAQALQAFLTTGAEARPIDEVPQMRRYLTWLETGDQGAAAPAAAAAPPAADQRPADGAKHGRKHHKKDKHGKHSKRHHKSSPATADKVSADEVDVELVKLPAPGGAKPMSPRSLLVVTPRDWVFLGIGAGAVIFAVLVGWILARAF